MNVHSLIQRRLSEAGFAEAAARLPEPGQEGATDLMGEDISDEILEETTAVLLDRSMVWVETEAGESFWRGFKRELEERHVRAIQMIEELSAPTRESQKVFRLVHDDGRYIFRNDDGSNVHSIRTRAFEKHFGFKIPPGEEKRVQMTIETVEEQDEEESDAA